MRVQTKEGEREVGIDAAFGNGHAEGLDAPTRVHPVSGEVTFRDHEGVERRLRPTFEALVEIEDGLAVGAEALRTKFAVAGLNPAMTPTTREYGVVLAAGLRAAGEARATVDGAMRFAFRCGRKALRKPLQEFLWALCDGGRPRAEDLNAAASSPNSAGDGGEAGEVNSLIEELESRSGNTSG